MTCGNANMYLHSCCHRSFVPSEELSGLSSLFIHERFHVVEVHVFSFSLWLSTSSLTCEWWTRYGRDVNTQTGTGSHV